MDGESGTRDEDTELKDQRGTRDEDTELKDEPGTRDKDTELEDELGTREEDIDLKDEPKTSDLRDKKSVISSSSVSTVDHDAIEATLYRLLHYGNLEFLWPQLVARCSSHNESCQIIEWFLRRYADDLGKRAVNPFTGRYFTEEENAMQLSAIAFVRRSRFNLAQRICETYRYRIFNSPETGFSSLHRANEHFQHGSSLDAVENEEKGEETAFIYHVAERFLFETAPISALERNVQNFLRKPSPQPPLDTFVEAIGIIFDDVVSWLRNPCLVKDLKRALGRREPLEDLKRAFGRRESLAEGHLRFQAEVRLRRREVLPEKAPARSEVLNEEDFAKNRVSWTCVIFAVVNINELPC